MWLSGLYVCILRDNCVGRPSNANTALSLFSRFLSGWTRNDNCQDVGREKDERKGGEGEWVEEGERGGVR